MLKLAGAILAGLLALQAGIPSLGLQEPWVNVATVGVTVAVASLTYYLKGTEPG